MEILKKFLEENKINLDKIVKIDLESIKELNSKWFMSKIFEAKSDDGEIIINCYLPIQEQVNQQVFSKIKLISDFLLTNSVIPTSRIFISCEYKWYYIIIQQKIEGKILWYRSLENNQIFDVFEFENNNIPQQICSYFKALHDIKLEWFGYPFLENWKIKGAFSTWIDFLDQMWNKWLDSIFNNYNEGFLTKKQYLNLKDKMKYQLDLNNNILWKVKPSLILGDATNPSNILISNNKISWFIDFEWWLIGDRCWEFAYGNKDYFLQKQYFQWFSEEEIIDFKKRLIISEIYWRLWGTSVHVKWNLIKDILFKEFTNLINNNE